MRLAIVIFVLLVLNLLLGAWQASRNVGIEAERLDHQFRADTIIALDSEEVKAQILLATNTAPPSSNCVSIRPVLGESLVELMARISATGIDATSQITDIQAPSIWLVYIGRFPDQESMNKKLADLQAQGIVDAIALQSPEFRYGISLGAYESRDAAAIRVTALNQLGISLPRVVEVIAPPDLKELRYNNVSPGAVASIAQIDPRAVNCAQ